MRDDGVGRAVLEALPSLNQVTKVDLETDVFRLMNVYKGEELLIFIDACRCGFSPGAVAVFEESHVPRYRSATAHALDPVEAINLMRLSGSVRPQKTYFVLIEAKDVEAGTELSAEVSDAIPLAVHEVLRLLGECHVGDH